MSDHANKEFILSDEFVTTLIQQQFPDYATLPITRVVPGGHDHRMFRVGDQLVARLPSAPCYSKKVPIEQKWLPYLGQRLPITIPKPIASGMPTKEYPSAWSLYRWIEGKSANLSPCSPEEKNHLAEQLANFIIALHQLPVPTDGILPGVHNFYRGAHPSCYGESLQESVQMIENTIEPKRIFDRWNYFLKSAWQHTPVWVHGDLTSGNILLEKNRLIAVIDFGGIAVGDPACDLTISWTFFEEESREIFQKKLSHIDQNTWNRARAWALWKALFTLADQQNRLSAEELDLQISIVNTVLN